MKQRINLKPVNGGFIHKDLPYLILPTKDVKYDCFHMKFYIEVPTRISIKEYFIGEPNNDDYTDHVLILYKKRLQIMPYRTWFKYFDSDEEDYEEDTYEEDTYEEDTYEEDTYEEDTYEEATY